MIPHDEINRLRALPIEQVAERLGLHVSRHKSLCPFHPDRHPSLTFSVKRNCYHCFVCGEHGGPIDLAMKLLNKPFGEACRWLADAHNIVLDTVQPAQKPEREYKPDTGWLQGLIQYPMLCNEASRWLYDERHIDPRVVRWCGLSSITSPVPCYRGGRPFYDAPSLLIPYRDAGGQLVNVQGRYLGKAEGVPRFRFPRGSQCHIYNLPVLGMLHEGEELYIAEGCSDCWALLSAGHKAIAIPSATMLKDEDIATLRNLNLHMYPDQDLPGERLFLELRRRLPQLVRHQLPARFKDYGQWWAEEMWMREDVRWMM